MSTFRASWSNGQRLLLVSFLVWFAVTGTGVVIGALALTGRDPLGIKASPLRLPSPQQIANTDEAPFSAGDNLIILGSKCNQTDAPLRIDGASFWSKLSPEPASVPYLTGGERILAPGCETRVFVNEIPDTLTPGIWRLEGENCTSGGDCAVWYTESFEVVDE